VKEESVVKAEEANKDKKGPRKSRDRGAEGKKQRRGRAAANLINSRLPSSPRHDL
jgi:hypothetical protein